MYNENTTRKCKMSRSKLFTLTICDRNTGKRIINKVLYDIFKDFTTYCPFSMCVLASPKAPLVKHNNVNVNSAFFVYLFILCFSSLRLVVFQCSFSVFFPQKQSKRLNKTGLSQGIISTSRMLVCMRTIWLIQFSSKVNECPSLSTHSQSL